MSYYARNPYTTPEPHAHTQRVSDKATLDIMVVILRSQIQQALHLCAAEARTLQQLDADRVMSALREQFAPGGNVDDLFADAFGELKRELGV